MSCVGNLQKCQLLHSKFIKQIYRFYLHHTSVRHRQAITLDPSLIMYHTPVVACRSTFLKFLNLKHGVLCEKIFEKNVSHFF